MRSNARVIAKLLRLGFATAALQPRVTATSSRTLKTPTRAMASQHNNILCAFAPLR